MATRKRKLRQKAVAEHVREFDPMDWYDTPWVWPLLVLFGVGFVKGWLDMQEEAKLAKAEAAAKAAQAKAGKAPVTAQVKGVLK
jgi:hypothetical protein